jgi:tetratricopeptide (TPR) repeat protein
MKMFVIAAMLWLLPQQAEEWFGRGINAYNQGKYGEAVEFFNKAVAADTSSVSTRFNRATAYLKLQRYGDALNDVNWCIARRPDRIAIRMQRAVIFAEAGQKQLALGDLDMIIAGDSTFPKARLLRGRLLLTTDTARGCADLRAVIAAGDSSAVRYMTGICP